jgi:hypothetical protein
LKTEVTGYFSQTSHPVTVGYDGEQAEKSGEFRPGILLPENLRNCPEPTVSWPDCSTWVVPLDWKNIYQTLIENKEVHHQFRLLPVYCLLIH